MGSGGPHESLLRPKGSGIAANQDDLLKLIDASQLELVVHTQVDAEETTDALLEQDRWLGDRLDLLTFDGWIERSGQRIAALLSRLPTEAVEVATMISESGPIELIDGLMLLPKAILGVFGRHQGSPRASCLRLSMNSLSLPPGLKTW